MESTEILYSRNRWGTEAPLVRGGTEDICEFLLMFLSTSLQNSGLQDFLKRLLPKLSATRTLLLCRSLCLRHLREIVCFHLRVLPLSV